MANLAELFSDMVAAGEVAEAYEKSAIKGDGEGEEEDDWAMEWWYGRTSTYISKLLTSHRHRYPYPHILIHTCMCKRNMGRKFQR